MASNRAIMPRAAGASHQLPDDVEGHADTRSQPRGRRNCKVLLQFQAHFPGERSPGAPQAFGLWANKVVRGTKSVAGLLKFPA